MCSPTLTFSHLFSVTFWNPCPPSQCLPISGSLSSELSPSTTTSLPLTLSPFVFSFSVQFSHSVLSDSLQPHGLQHCQASLSITNSQSLLKLMSIESVMPSNHLILCHLLLLPPSIFPSIRVFFSESVLHIRWPKDWSFSFSISPSNEYSGLISFRRDWLDLLAVQGTLRVFSNTTVQKHQFFHSQPSLGSNSHIHM